MLRLGLPHAAHGAAGALGASRAVLRAPCAVQLVRPTRGPAAAAALSLRRARAPVRAHALVTRTAAENATVEHYIAAATEQLRSCGGVTDTSVLNKMLLEL